MAIYVRAIDQMSNHTAADLRGSIGDILFQEGVVDLSGGHLEVTENTVPDMSVNAAKGIAYVLNDSFTEFSSLQHYWDVIVDSDQNVSISSNPSGSTRIDLICLKIDTTVTPDANASNVATVVAVEGTPGGGAPSLPSNHLQLAQVSVANGATSITDANITDSRQQLEIKKLGSDESLNDFLDTPKRTVYASNFQPTTTDGCGTLAQEEVSGVANFPKDFFVLPFDSSSDERAFANFAWPASWGAGTIRFRFFGFVKSGVGSAGQTVVFDLKAICFSNDDALDTNFTAGQNTSITLTTQEDMQISAWSSAITIANTPAAGDMMNIILTRDVSEDTLSGDFQLIGIQIEYQQDSYGD